MLDLVTTNELAELLPYLTAQERGELDRLLLSDCLPFADFLTRHAPHIHHYPHIRQLVAVLQRVADGELKRLMVFMPPRHGKSEIVSRWFPAYMLYRFPERWVALTSYSGDLAYTLSRNARENYYHAVGVLEGDTKAVKQWETGKGGGLIAAGYAGGFTGKGFHCGIVDDPLKGAEEAASATIREKHKDWWKSVWFTRQEPDAALIVVQTRWHEEDLSGFLLSEENGEEPQYWHIVNMPAIAEDDSEREPFPATCTTEPDYRAIGEALCPERYSATKLLGIMRTVGSYFWNALYRQNPKPREGGFFKRAWFEQVVTVLPKGCTFVRYWDKAATAGGGDWTVGVLMARDMATGDYYIADVVRGQWSPGERDRRIRETAAADKAAYGEVQTWGEQEPGASGKNDAIAFVRMLDGYTVRVEPASGSKEVRAMPLSSQAEVGNVKLLKGAWNTAFVNELCDFPNGSHDDQVDGASGAFNRLSVTRRLTAY